MPHFSNALSTALHDLRMIANAGNRSITAQQPPESTRPRPRASQSLAKSVPLSSQLYERMHRLRQIQLSELPTARARMAVMAAKVQAARAAVMERTVVLLERAKHGALARATKAKAEHLAMVAQGVEGKLKVMKLDVSATIYTPETVAALGRYQQHLRDTRERWEERHAAAREKLKAYEEVDSEGAGTTSRSRAVGSGQMKEIARRYGTLIQEMEDVRSEIQRLNR
ncbi:hypothetical protein EYZ11_004909 [Aspergillus tanneri]|nr:hypothetical protein EYZ11_004909 [Aspergillus tanneri]